MTALHVAFVVLYLACLAVRDGYEWLKATARIDPVNTAVFAVVFTSMCLMWVSWFGMGVVAPTRFVLPAAVRWGGLALVIAGVVLALGGIWSLRGVENIDHLVTTGVFSKFRHPMYVGFALWILGWVAYQSAPSSLAVAPLGLASIAWWRSLEERDLQSRYGEAYVAYRSTTWV